MSAIAFSASILLCIPAALSQPSVIPLIQGRLVELDNGGFDFLGSSTLVRDGNTNIVVDTPSGSDAAGRTTMLNILTNQCRLTPDQVQILVITHGHPDHFGSDVLFPNARQMFFSFEHKGTIYTEIKYSNGRARLSSNVEQLQTPGHTPQDVTVIVSNVPNQGTVAITGDLIYDADDALNATTAQAAFAWNIDMLLQNRNGVLCEADYIYPGHGAPFQVTPQMRQLANCQQRVADQPKEPMHRNLRIQMPSGRLMRPSIYQRQELMTGGK